MSWVSSVSAGSWYGPDTTTTYVDYSGKSETYIYVAKERKGYTIDQYHKLKAKKLNDKVHSMIRDRLT